MFGEQDPTTTTTTTEDPFADFDTAFESTVTEDPFFSFDDDPFFNGGGGPLPPCTEFSMVRYFLSNEIKLFKSYYHLNLSDTIKYLSPKIPYISVIPKQLCVLST